MSVAQIMNTIIANSPEIPAEVRASAAAIPGGRISGGVNNELIPVMRRWWEQNQEAVREERYSDVTAPSFIDLPRLDEVSQ